MLPTTEKENVSELFKMVRGLNLIKKFQINDLE